VNASRPTIQVTRFVARGVRASSYARPVREPFNAGYR